MNSLNNINKCDLLFLSNKELYNKAIEDRTNEYDNLTEDFKKYKKVIKHKINKLYQSYLDCSGNMGSLLKSNNDTIKYKNYFYLFVSGLIENIKLQELKKDIKFDLSGCINGKDRDGTEVDISNNLLDIDKRLADNNRNIDSSKKIVKLDSFVTVINKKPKPKILPKKR